MALSITQKLKLFRISNNLTQLEIAKRLGVQVVTISRWETNKATPNERHVFTINKILSESKTK